MFSRHETKTFYDEINNVLIDNTSFDSKIFFLFHAYYSDLVTWF